MNESLPGDSSRMDVTASVLKYAEEQGITLTQLIDMVDSSAKVTHDLGNRRHHNWVFRVENNVVKSMKPLAFAATSGKVRPQYPNPGPGEFLAFDECEDCDGVGCEMCDHQGDVPIIRKIPKARNGVRNEW